jgi:hypothetical protein
MVSGEIRVGIVVEHFCLRDRGCVETATYHGADSRERRQEHASPDAKENQMATYRNPWHKPLQSIYGPAHFECTAAPAEHRGFLIYRRLPNCFDVVKDGVCLHQRAGLRGAHNAIDALVAA